VQSPLAAIRNLASKIRDEDRVHGKVWPKERSEETRITRTRQGRSHPGEKNQTNNCNQINFKFDVARRRVASLSLSLPKSTSSFISLPLPWRGEAPQPLLLARYFLVCVGIMIVSDVRNIPFSSRKFTALSPNQRLPFSPRDLSLLI